MSAAPVSLDFAAAKLSPDLSPDLDPIETREWLGALAAVLRESGPERAQYLSASWKTSCAHAAVQILCSLFRPIATPSRSSGKASTRAISPSKKS